MDFFDFIVPRQPVVPPTPREEAERWLHALAGADAVEAAETDAEVEFRKQERAANWRAWLGKINFGSEPPSWPAGAEYTRRMLVGFGKAAFAHIKKPRAYERFLHEALAILAETTYRQKLRPYEHVVGAEAEARAIAKFHEYARMVASTDVNELAYEAWERHRKRYHQKQAGVVGSVGEVVAKVENSGEQPERTEAASPSLPSEVSPLRMPSNGNGTGERREDRLQQFVREHNTSIAAVGRAANVAKPELQEWRKDTMKATSVMARRIEDVLSGKTPLEQKEAG